MRRATPPRRTGGGSSATRRNGGPGQRTPGTRPGGRPSRHDRRGTATPRAGRRSPAPTAERQPRAGDSHAARHPTSPHRGRLVCRVRPGSHSAGCQSGADGSHSVERWARLVRWVTYARRSSAGVAKPGSADSQASGTVDTISWSRLGVTRGASSASAAGRARAWWSEVVRLRHRVRRRLPPVVEDERGAVVDEPQPGRLVAGRGPRCGAGRRGPAKIRRTAHLGPALVPALVGFQLRGQ